MHSYIPELEVISFAKNAYTLDDFNDKFHKAMTIYMGHHEFKELIQEYLMIYYCKLNPSFREYYLEWLEHMAEGSDYLMSLISSAFIEGKQANAEVFKEVPKKIES